VKKYFRALRRAQRDIDLRPERYTHYYRKEFPRRFSGEIDTRPMVLYVSMTIVMLTLTYYTFQTRKWRL